MAYLSTPLFNPSLLRSIAQHLKPRARIKVPYNQPLKELNAQEQALYELRSKRKASVLIPLLNYHNKPCILYTLRTGTVSTHRNEISFPGGHTDHTDISMVHAALREFHEELGVHFRFNIHEQTPSAQFEQFVGAGSDSSAVIASQPFMSDSSEPGVNALDVEILGSLFDCVPSKHGTPVQPIVAFISLSKLHALRKADLIGDLLHPDRHEVAQVFAVPVDELLNPAHQKREELAGRGTSVRYSVPSAPDHVDIWGLTGLLTHSLLHHVLLPSIRSQLL